MSKSIRSGTEGFLSNEARQLVTTSRVFINKVFKEGYKEGYSTEQIHFLVSYALNEVAHENGQSNYSKEVPELK